MQILFSVYFSIINSDITTMVRMTLTKTVVLIVLSCFIVYNFLEQQYIGNIREKTKNNTTTRFAAQRAYDYNWTILVSTNTGFHDFFLNWWWHFQRLNIRVPIIVVAEDDFVYKKLLDQFYHAAGVTVEKGAVVLTSEAVKYGELDYKRLVSERPAHISKQLKKGKNVVYSDIDTVWLKNPFDYFIGKYDMWIPMGLVRYCTGFMALKSNERTIQLIEDWEDELKNTLQTNQPAFNKCLKKSKVNHFGFDESLFPTGKMFNEFNTTQKDNVVVMHNTLVIGHDKKLERFKELNLWFQYMK